MFALPGCLSVLFDELVSNDFFFIDCRTFKFFFRNSLEKIFLCLGMDES